MVPANWEHPKMEHYIRGETLRPLHEPSRPVIEMQREWLAESEKWAAGNHPDQIKYGDTCPSTLEEWSGSCPDARNYMPFWPDGEKTHFQMYETCSEGTPISPVMHSPEELARWLADNNASSFGKLTSTYEKWLALIVGPGSAPSAIITSGGAIRSGVDWVDGGE